MDFSPIINKITEEWLTEFILDLQDRARERVGVSSGEGVKSIDGAVIRATTQTAATVMVSFQDHLRLYDMRKVQRDGGVDATGMDRIEDWIRREGVSNFLSGYKGKQTVTKKGVATAVPINTIINNIAWGIARSKRKLKRKVWYNKTKGKQVYRLYAQLVDAVLDAGMEEITAAIEK